ncbi:EmrB/QacA subfamily drug resistance transporter [Tamaricihabitans halophyticus]|uniref:EmrB/QacA subfamily drug resistance transporter n=1 Tax=Tamaricihabitans halophyticus TaxID=1262583 RepID=A0A4R2QUP8_9PSEU|nr:DHA2 family efflux MFS transporter permease subunit [Tamaricihabitans halophyticus]TCP50821.1 EmrB/QacA subfamily drug resistance transporter [Tamaricihabitans halophyticus]
MSRTTASPVTGDGSAAAPTSAESLSHKQIVTILIGLMTGMFLAALDQTIVGTSIRTIADDLHGLSLQAWITTAYLITATISTPIYGKLSDIYGRKPFYLAAISIFIAGSIAATFAQSMYQLAAFRAIQGLGAGGLMSLAMTILGDLVPPRRRAKYQGYFLAVFGTSTVLGPVLGGFFAGIDTFAGVDGWRWVFLVNVPLGAIALFVVAKVLNVPHERHNHRIDWWGGLALIIGLVPLLLVAEQGREWGWGSTRSLVCFGIGAFGILLFILIERAMRDEALIPLRLFRNATFAVAIVGGFIVGIAMFGAIMLVPQYLQIVQGYTPTESGLLMLPLMVGVMSASVLSGQLTSRTGRYKIFPIIGTALMTVGMLLFAQIEWNSPLWQPMLYMFVIGIGLGNCMQTLIIAVQNAGPKRDMGVSTATATFFRQIGGTTGVAVFMSILFSTLMGNVVRAFQNSGMPPEAMGAGGNIMEDSSFLQQLPIEQARPFFIGFTDSLSTVFYVGAGVAALAFLVLLFMREIPLADGAGPAAATLEGGEAALDDTDGTDDSVVAPSANSATAGDGARHRLASESEWVEPEFAEALPVGAGNGQAHPTDTASSAAQAPSVRTAALPVASASADLPQAEPVAEPSGAVIWGTVRQGDGSAVADTALTLIDPRGRQVGRGRSGIDGVFRLVAPGPGSYVLIGAAEAHQPEAYTVTVDNQPVELALVLTGTSSLGGAVTTEDTGQAVAGATVTLTDGRGEVISAEQTDVAGNYRFAELVAGAYTLVVSAAGHRPSAVAVTVPGSGATRQDVRLTGGAQLHGVARTGSADRAVADARITLLDANGNVMGVTITGPSGEYRFTDLPEGDYTVIASGYPPVASALRVEPGQDGEHDVRLGYPEDGQPDSTADTGPSGAAE